MQVQAHLRRVGCGEQMRFGVHAWRGGNAHHRQRRLAQHHLHRCGQTLPHDGGTQRVVAVDHHLQCAEKIVQPRPVVEAEHDPVEVTVAFGLQHVVKQHAFLQCGKPEDVLHIGGAARNPRDDRVDLGLAHGHQGQQLGANIDATRHEAVCRHDRGVGRHVVALDLRRQ